MIDIKVDGKEIKNLDARSLRIIQRISSNEKIVTQLETLHLLLLNEIDDCKTPSISGKDADKYGMQFGSLISDVLASYLAVKTKESKGDKCE